MTGKKVRESVVIDVPRWVKTAEDRHLFGFHLAAVCCSPEGTLQKMCDALDIPQPTLSNYVNSWRTTPLSVIRKVNGMIGTEMIKESASREAKQSL